MDAASEKAGLKRLLGTAGTLGLQQLDDSETASTEDSGPPPQEDSEPGEQSQLWLCRWVAPSLLAMLGVVGLLVRRCMP